MVGVQVQHGVANAELVLMSASDQRCSCIGTPSEPAAAGSPWAHLCDASWGSDCTASSSY